MNERTLVIAGPGQHFAEAVARRYAKEGFEIALIGRNQDKLENTELNLGACGIRATTIQADFTSDESVCSAVSRCATELPPWGCIIYNVKQSHPGSLANVDLQAVLADFDSNVLGAARLTRIALENWWYAHEASIILAGGGYKDEPDVNKLSLSVSKAALHTLALGLQKDPAIQNVHVSEVVIDGTVRDEGPLFPKDLADVMWQTHAAQSDAIVPFPAIIKP